jgi:hypothetical protein
VTEIQRLEPHRTLVAVYDDEEDDYIYPGHHHEVVAVVAVGTDGKEHGSTASLRDGLLGEDPRNAETVYQNLERHLEAAMRAKGVWAES